MTTRISSTRAMLATAAIVLGAVMLAAIPIYLVFLALTEANAASVPGTWVILMSVLGMGMVAVGAALGE